MMKNSELLLTLGKILEENQEIKDWCNSYFGKVPTIYLGIDTENPPLETEYPLIILFYVERLKGESERKELFSVEIGAGLFKKELDTPEPIENPNLKVYTGLLLVEDFREIVEEALFSSMPRIRGKIDVTGETTPESYYPFFHSNTRVSIEFIRTSRKPLGK